MALDYVIKISEPGYDHNSGDAHLIFNSKYPLLKVHSSGSWDIFDNDGTGGTLNVYHNLGYKPMFFVWGQWWDEISVVVHEDYAPFPFSDYAGLQIYNNYLAVTDTEKLDITLDISSAGAPSSQTYLGFYIIFYEPNV